MKRYWAGSWSPLQRAMRLTFVLGAVLAAPLSPGPLVLPVLGLGVAISLLALLPSRVSVDADGILLRWLFLRTFVPFAEIEEVSRRAVPLRGKWGSVGTRHEIEIERSNAPTIALRSPSSGLMEEIVAARSRLADGTR